MVPGYSTFERRAKCRGRTESIRLNIMEPFRGGFRFCFRFSKILEWVRNPVQSLQHETQQFENLRQEIEMLKQEHKRRDKKDKRRDTKVKKLEQEIKELK